MLEYFVDYTGSFFFTIVIDNTRSSFDQSMSSLSETMFTEQTNEDTDLIDEFASELEDLKVTASNTNAVVGGVSYSSEILEVHELIRTRKLVYNVNKTPSGKWAWSGMREIRKKGGDNKPNFVLPDGIATFYGNLDYDYALSDGSSIRTINHDIISMSSIILDVKPRSTSKNPDSGVYGIDWWNIYMPIPSVVSVVSAFIVVFVLVVVIVRFIDGA